VNRVVTVLLGRARARVFDVRAEGTKELPCLHSPETRGGKFHSDRADAPGRGEHAYHGRIREELRRHLAAIVAHLTVLTTADAMVELVLAGPQELVKAAEALLTPALRARLIGTLRVDPKRATVAIITRKTKELQQAWTQLMPG